MKDERPVIEQIAEVLRKDIPEVEAMRIAYIRYLARQYAEIPAPVEDSCRH